MTAESVRLAEDAARARNWKRWGTYLPERQWGTVREDYSPGGSCWEYFPHDDVNYLLVEALQRYHHYYGDRFQVECPVGSGRMMNLEEVAADVSSRLTRIFLPDESGRRPCHGDDERYQVDEHWRDLILFYEHFHGDSGRGVGASHQTGWTALVTRLFSKWGSSTASKA